VVTNDMDQAAEALSLLITFSAAAKTIDLAQRV
jgi:hypothetical protein